MGPAQARVRNRANDAGVNLIKMSSDFIYLDHNATTPVYPEVFEAMLPYYKENYGNASSVYQLGQQSRKAVEEARVIMARFVGADDPNEIIFTSGATESNNMAIKGILEAHQSKGKRIVSSAIEHSSIRNVLSHLAKTNKVDVVTIPVTKDGLLQMDQVDSALTPDTVLCTVMTANNEIGTIQPIQECAPLAKKKNIPFLADAAQTAGKMPIRVNELNVDLLSLSAHKFGGPKGIGLLYVRQGTKMESFIQGGSHEKNRRAGTENVAAIVGMAKAAQIAMENFNQTTKKLSHLRDSFEDLVLKTIPLTYVNGSRSNRIPNTSNIGFDCIESTGLLMALDLENVACSNGSACSTGSVEASHVLLAMGLPQEKAHSALRFSFGSNNNEAQIQKTVSILASAVQRLRKNHPLWKDVAHV